MSVENEASRLISMTDGLVTELLSTLGNIPKELLNQDVGIPEVNTPFVLGRHVLGSIEPVSYTHLTLPTIYSV